MSEQLITLNQSEIATATTAELKAALTKGLTISAKQLAYLAQIWRELENRGEDLSALKSGLAIYLPLIAEDRLDPEVVVRFAGQRTLLTAMMSLSVRQQREMLEQETVSFVSIDDERNRVVEKKTLQQLSAQQVKQIIHQGEIATEDEQYRNLLDKQPPKAKKSAKRRVARKITFEQLDDIELMSIGGKRVKIESVVSALAEHYDLEASELQEFLSR